MNKVAQFYKVSKHRFIEDSGLDASVYDSIKLPVRATKGSAGYDFFSPIDFTLQPNEGIKVPTGIRVKVDEGWMLAIFPRSGLGFKYKLRLDNTVGIIDSDYYYSTNEGHIMIKLTNCSPDKTLTVTAGQGFAQGIFLPFGITEDDFCDTERDGGFGSTDKK